MDVILLERIEKLGFIGDIVKVKTGYARNFLLPQKKALRASKENLAYFETQKAQLEADNLQAKADAEKIQNKHWTNRKKEELDGWLSCHLNTTQFKVLHVRKT